MSDFTEVTRRGWGGRMKNSFGGIIFGFILSAAAVFMLFWNEGRAVKRYKDLKEGAGAVISIVADKIDPANEGKLVHLTGNTTTSAPVSDPEFGIAEKAIKLLRKAEMFQWTEKTSTESKKKVGGSVEETKTYTYRKEWREGPVDSSSFKIQEGHVNPGEMPIRSKTLLADTVKLGAFTLPDFLIAKINNSEPYRLTSLDKASEEIRKTGRLHGNGVYFGNDPANPQIGDARVSFSVIKPGTVSAVAKQVASSFAKYPTKTGNTVELLEIGEMAAADMFQLAQDRNKTLTWILRGVGFMMMGFGFSMILRPLSVAADVIPFLGNIVGAGTTAVAFLLAAIVWTIVVAVAWIIYRPLIGIALLVVTVALLVVLIMKMNKAKKQNAAAPAGAGSSAASPPPFSE